MAHGRAWHVAVSQLGEVPQLPACGLEQGFLETVLLSPQHLQSSGKEQRGSQRGTEFQGQEEARIWYSVGQVTPQGPVVLGLVPGTRREEVGRVKWKAEGYLDTFILLFQ